MKIPIVRDEIKIPSMESEVLEGNLGLITINRFGEETAVDVEEALRNMLDKNIDGLIVDLRFNGGGYLERAVELSSMFLAQGKVVSVVRREGEPANHYVKPETIAPDLPLVILINEGSASASEIFAGALQDAERATIVGMTSFGKGIVQEVYELPGGTSLRVTIAKWLTPSGKDLSSEGIEPDIVVERTREQIENDEDPQLDVAIENLKSKI